MADHDLHGRVALVTGASHGIGLEVARQLADLGATVYLSARSQAQAADAAQRLDDALDVRPLALDVSDDASVRAAADAVRDAFGHLDILVNNAARFADWQERPSTADLDAARALLDTNLFGAWRVCQAFLPLLKASAHGRLVNVSSGAGTHGDAAFGLTANGGGAASYGVSKAALNALTAQLAAELADTSVLVNAAGPGLTATAPGMEAMGARPVADGARSVVWAALLPDDGPRGGFFRDGERLPW